MKFTVVTPVKNCGDEIFKTISSVRAQVNVDVEHLIIDGGQINPSLWNRLDPSKNLRIVYSEDTGIYDAFNKGVSLANGEFIGFLGSGDRFADQTSLEALKNTFLETGSDAVYGDLAFVAMGRQNMIVRNWVAGEYSRLKLLFGWMPPHPALFVRRACYQRWGLFTLALRPAADYELMLRFIHRHGMSLAYLPKTLVLMRAGGVSNASLKHRIRAHREDWKAWRMNGYHPSPFTLLAKPLRKLPQFLSRA